MLNINAKESRNLIHQIASVKTAAVIDRFNRMAQLSVATQAQETGEKLASEHFENVKNTNLPGALAVATMMSKASSEEEGPVIAANARKLAGLEEDVLAKLRGIKDSVPDVNEALHYNVLERGRDRVVDAAKDLLHGNVPRYSLYDQAKDLASQAGDRVGEAGGGIKDRLEGLLSGIKDKGHGLMEGARGAAYRTGLADESLSHLIGEHPGAAAGVGAGALGAGGLAAYLATRDSKKDRD